MSRLTFRKLPLLMVLAALPVVASAATPVAFLERSKVVATGKVIKAYRVPLRDVNGKIRYRDITITLNVADNGVPATTAAVSSVASPNINTNQFVTGPYTWASFGPSACTLDSSILDGGRSLYQLSCTFPSNGQVLNAIWYSGPIAGSPLQTELIAAGVDKVPSAASFGWGKVTADSANWQCLNLGNIIGVAQVNGNLQINNYIDSYPTYGVNCGITLVK